MPAKNKDELLTRTRREFSKLTRVLDRISEREAMVPDRDGISIKDIVGHRAHWLVLYRGWVRDGRAGKEVHTPAPGFKWNQLPEMNAHIRAEQAGMTWVDVRQMLLDEHEALLDFIEAETDENLYGGERAAWMNDWTLGRWAEAAGGAHYASAAKYIRMVLRKREADRHKAQRTKAGSTFSKLAF